MDLQTQDLDAEELLHLAIQSSKSDRHDQAITYLKHAMAKSPEDANLVYFLGAEHAQIGLYERAMEEMGQALTLNPELHAARYQLGLLYLSSGLAQPALDTFAPFEALGEASYFYWFGKGLGHLIRDEFADCKSALEKGIQLNQGNPALNNDMTKMIEAVDKKLQEAPGKEVAEASSAGGSLWLSAYQNENEDTSN